jgi:hypothetical protein
MSDTDPDTSEFLPPSQLAERYGVSDRTIDRWAKDGQVRTMANPRRRGAKLYHRADVERLVRVVPPPAAPVAPAVATTEIISQSEILRMLDDAQHRAERAMLEVGRLQGQVESQQRLLEAAQDSEQRRIAAESERDQLRRDLSRLPWWVRLWWIRRR